MVVIPAGREERRLAPPPLGHFEAEHAVVEADGRVHVRGDEGEMVDTPPTRLLYETSHGRKAMRRL